MRHHTDDLFAVLCIKHHHNAPSALLKSHVICHRVHQKYASTTRHEQQILPLDGDTCHLGAGRALRPHPPAVERQGRRRTLNEWFEMNRLGLTLWLMPVLCLGSAAQATTSIRVLNAYQNASVGTTLGSSHSQIVAKIDVISE